MSKVLVIGDTHCPAMHKNYIKFLQSVQKKWNTTKTVHIGDVIDHHCISFHEKHPDNPGAIAEHKLASRQINMLYAEWPNMTVCIGNHDARVRRLNSKQGIPAMYLKEFNDLYGTSGWNWIDSVEIDGVHYYHGEGVGGMHPAFNAARMRMQPTVVGHYHSSCGVWYQAGPTTKVWGMNVGCGVDRNHWSMQYGAAYLKKPIVGCGVVIDGVPYVETMKL
jgi:predicted phosphodiesterase